MEQNNSIALKYKFITRKSNYEFKEVFKPYSGNELLISNYFESNYSEFQTFIIDKEHYDLSFLPRNSYENNANIDSIIPNYSDIVLDTIFTLYFCFDPNGIYFYNLENKELPDFYDSNSILYIGLFTELLKFEIDSFKYDLSIIINILNNQNISDTQKNRLLNTILSKYIINININVSNQQSVSNALVAFLNCMSVNRSNTCEIDINLFAYDTFIQLLKKHQMTNYIYKKQCFCLCKENSKFYFTLSGVKKEPNKHMFDILQQEIETIVANEFNLSISISYCMLSDSTLSYGRMNKNGVFEKFSLLKLPSPISYKNYDESKYLERKIDSFTCCERKLFAGLPEQKGTLTIYCKYEPCARCIPAIEDNEKKYAYIQFNAFAKNFEVCKKMIENHQKTILSHTNYSIYTCYEFINKTK